MNQLAHQLAVDVPITIEPTAGVLYVPLSSSLKATEPEALLGSEKKLEGEAGGVNSCFMFIKLGGFKFQVVMLHTNTYKS